MSTAKLLGIGEKLSYKGVDYPINPMNVDQIAEFEAWIEGELWKAHNRASRFLPEADAKDLRLALLKDIGLGTYAYPQPGFFQALMKLPGAKRSVWITLRDNPQYKNQITEDMVNEMVDAKFAEVVVAMMENESDPFQKQTPQ